MTDFWIPRRTLLKGSAAVLGTAALSTAPISSAFAARFPSDPIKVMVATREGGGADRNLRAFWSVWKNYLKTRMEASFYPGAAGRVGYEKYMGIAKPDCYTLLFGNMGPEILNWVVQPPSGFKYPGDYVYFNQVDADPGCIFVDAKRSKIKTIDDLVKLGKKQTLKVGVSRIAHPATLGILALGKERGFGVNVIPLSGGKNTRNAVKSGEMDCGALPTGGIARRWKNFRILTHFDTREIGGELGKKMYNAPPVNKHFGTNFPALIAGARAFAIKAEAIKKYPDRFAILEETGKKVISDPEFEKNYKKTKAPFELIKYGNRADCEEYAKNIWKVGMQFRDLMKGKT
jgi:putative tricarboxylic transport membrane protein